MISLNGRWLGPWTAVILVAALQLGALVSMVWGRVSLLQTGREISADVVPVDPRDIFRGDYVVLGYSFSVVTHEAAPLPEGAYENGPIYVTLAPDGTNWKAIGMTLDYPANSDPANVVLKGRIDQVWVRPEGGKEGRVRFGIESYFVPEGTGREIENLVREKKVRAILAVGPDGTAAVKALEAEGKRLHEQPPL